MIIYVWLWEFELIQWQLLYFFVLPIKLYPCTVTSEVWDIIYCSHYCGITTWELSCIHTVLIAACPPRYHHFTHLCDVRSLPSQWVGFTQCIGENAFQAIEFFIGWILSNGSQNAPQPFSWAIYTVQMSEMMASPVAVGSVYLFITFDATLLPLSYHVELAS